MSLAPVNLVSQGLYRADQRFGPGVESYADGRQDVGLWARKHLIKLCTEGARGFSIHNYPEYAGFLTRSPARLSLADEEEVDRGQPEGQDPFFYDYKRFLLDDDLTLPPEMYVYSTDNSHLPMTRSFRKELDARVFLNDIPPFMEDGEPWFIKNETPLMVTMQKHAYRYRQVPPFLLPPMTGLRSAPGSWLSNSRVTRRVHVKVLLFEAVQR